MTDLVFSVRNAILAAGAPLTGPDGAPVSWGWRVRWVCERLAEARRERDEARGALVRLTWESSPQGVDPATVPAHWTWVVICDDPPAGQWERPGAWAGKLKRGGAFWASNVVGRGQCATVAEAIGVVDYALGVPERP